MKKLSQQVAANKLAMQELLQGKVESYRNNKLPASMTTPLHIPKLPILATGRTPEKIRDAGKRMQLEAQEYDKAADLSKRFGLKQPSMIKKTNVKKQAAQPSIGEAVMQLPSDLHLASYQN